MEWEAVDSAVVCQAECSSASMACLEEQAEEPVEWLSTLTKSSKCLWDNKWEEQAHVAVVVASKVS